MSEKEIGSIFPYFEDNGKDLHNYNSFFTSEYDLFSLGREAILYLAKKYGINGSKVLLPAYTCQTVIDPFIQEGWTCIYYEISKDLRIQQNSILSLLNREKPTLMVAHPFYGQGFTKKEKDILRIARSIGTIVTIDLTQSIFLELEDDIFDYYVASLRKWFPIPDGGFLYPKQGCMFSENQLLENLEFVIKQRDAMYLRAEYFKTNNQELKQISIRLNKEAVKSITDNQLNIHKISEFSKEILLSEDLVKNQNSRLQNYLYLLENLSNKEDYVPVNSTIDNLESAPLYFPLYVNDREKLQKELANSGIYAPVLWPIVTHEVLISEAVEYIYNHILLIPIDQRYSLDDMERIVNTIYEKE